MFILEMRPKWGAIKELHAMEEAAPGFWAAVLARHPRVGLPVQLPDVDSYWNQELGPMEAETALALLEELPAQFELGRVKGLHYPALGGMGGLPLSEVVAAIKGSIPPSVHVSVPNVSLFSVQSIDVLEDACTYGIQRLLNAGWRIIAVCPPNDCRRPTYIMGHLSAGERV